MRRGLGIRRPGRDPAYCFAPGLRITLPPKAEVAGIIRILKHNRYCLLRKIKILPARPTDSGSLARLFEGSDPQVLQMLYVCVRNFPVVPF